MDNIRNFIRNNILTTAEAADILQVSKAAVSRFEELEPVKKNSQGTLYLRADVEAYKRRRDFGIVNMLQVTDALFDRSCNTYKSLDFYKENRDRLGSIIAIYIFFGTMDPAIHNFYITSETYDYGELKYVEAAHFVLRDDSGKEMWLSGCNCGYGGTGPNGSVDVLDLLKEEGTLNQEQFTEKRIKRLIFDNRIIKMHKEGGSNLWDKLRHWT